MSVGTEGARRDFAKAMRDPGNLMALHTRTGRGRRHREPSLNRAVVVMTTAAWQSYVQDTTEAILDVLQVPAGDPGAPLFNLIKASTKGSLGRFNTPNARNSLALFQQVGFDPTRSWTFSIGDPPRAYAAPDVSREIDDWLAVRHKIAHGAPLPSLNIVSGRPATGPQLWKRDAERCVDFFNAVVGATATEADGQFP